MTRLELEQCISKYGKDIYSFCRYLTRNQQEAEDLYQDTFLRMIQLKENVQMDSNPKSYLLSVAMSIWKNRRRKAAWRERIAHIVAFDEKQGEEALIIADETPMPETTEDAYSEQDFFISPLIKGYNPKDYNAITMHGSATTIVENGVLYRLVVCDNVEIFADCGLYMCVLDQTFYSSDYYIYDEETGEISRNEAYGGLNALFALPIDSAKGNPQKAAAYIESLGIVETAKQQERVDKVELEQSEIAEEDSVGVQVAEFALQFVGTPYEWGGTSLPEGVDCSGFVKSVYEEFGVILPHSAVQDMEEGEAVAGLENALPGDLIIYENPSHVGIYIGDGKIVHVDTKFGVCIADVEYAEISIIRRVVLEK